MRNKNSLDGLNSTVEMREDIVESVNLRADQQNLFKYFQNIYLTKDLYPE